MGKLQDDVPLPPCQCMQMQNFNNPHCTYKTLLAFTFLTSLSSLSDSKLF